MRRTRQPGQPVEVVRNLVAVGVRATIVLRRPWLVGTCVFGVRDSSTVGIDEQARTLPRKVEIIPNRSQRSECLAAISGVHRQTASNRQLCSPVVGKLAAQT